MRRLLIGTAGAWFVFDYAHYGNTLSLPAILKGVGQEPTSPPSSPGRSQCSPFLPCLAMLPAIWWLEYRGSGIN